MEKLRNSAQWSLGPQHHENQLWSNEGEGAHMLITCVMLMMIDVVMQGQGRVTWRTMRFLVIKLFCQPFCICSGVVVLAMKVPRFWFTITWSFMVQTLKNTFRRIHKSYCSRPIHTKRCYWAVILERIESRTLESHESLECLVCLVCQVCQCLSWKTYTCWKKQNRKPETKLHTLYAIYWTPPPPWDWRTKV